MRTLWLGFFNLTIFFIFLYFFFMRFYSFLSSSFFSDPNPFRGFDVQVCLRSFCSKFNGGSDRIFRFWIRSVFHGQNTWKTEHVFNMTLVFGDFFMKKTTLSKILLA